MHRLTPGTESVSRALLGSRQHQFLSGILKIKLSRPSRIFATSEFKINDRHPAELKANSFSAEWLAHFRRERSLALAPTFYRKDFERHRFF